MRAPTRNVWGFLLGLSLVALMGASAVGGFPYNPRFGTVTATDTVSIKDGATAGIGGVLQLFHSASTTNKYTLQTNATTLELLERDGTPRLSIADNATMYLGDDDGTAAVSVGNDFVDLGEMVRVYQNGAAEANVRLYDGPLAGGFYVELDYDGGASGELTVKPKSGAETAAIFASDGAVSLYYDNSAKLATSSAGGTLTGTWNATTDLQVNGASVLTTASNDRVFPYKYSLTGASFTESWDPRAAFSGVRDNTGEVTLTHNWGTADYVCSVLTMNAAGNGYFGYIEALSTNAITIQTVTHADTAVDPAVIMVTCYK